MSSQWSSQRRTATSEQQRLQTRFPDQGSFNCKTSATVYVTNEWWRCLTRPKVNNFASAMAHSAIRRSVGKIVHCYEMLYFEVTYAAYGNFGLDGQPSLSMWLRDLA